VRQPAHRLASILAGVWAQDGERRKKAGVPSEIDSDQAGDCAATNSHGRRTQDFQSGSAGDAAYGTDTKFREELTVLRCSIGRDHVPGDVWEPSQGRWPARHGKDRGKAHEKSSSEPTACTVTVKNLGLSCRAGVEEVMLASRNRHQLQRVFAAWRVRPAQPLIFERSEPYPTMAADRMPTKKLTTKVLSRRSRQKRNKDWFTWQSP